MQTETTILRLMDARVRGTDQAIINVFSSTTALESNGLTTGSGLRCGGYRWRIRELLAPKEQEGEIRHTTIFGAVLDGPRVYTNFVLRLEAAPFTQEEFGSMTHRAASLLQLLAAFDAEPYYAALKAGMGSDDPLANLIRPHVRNLANARRRKQPDIDTLNAMLVGMQGIAPTAGP